ncbi:uncharacterized protein [Watersipora subatra]|uniref:uncharacterized protein n=1 Tax=Watersipora subatra TaxID=2589382 RepID=UPI00355C8FBF
MATIKDVFRATADSEPNLTEKFIIKDKHYFHDNYKRVKDGSPTTSKARRCKSKSNGALYGVKKYKNDGQKPANECLGDLMKSFALFSLFTQCQHENVLQYDKEKSYIVIPERTPHDDTIDLEEMGIDFPKSRLLSFIGTTVYLVFDMNLFPETLESILLKCVTVGYPLPESCVREVLEQVISALEHFQTNNINISLDGLDFRNFVCNGETNFFEFPHVCLAHFQLAIGDSEDDTTSKALFLGTLLTKLEFFAKNGTFLSDRNARSIMRLISKDAKPALRLLLQKLCHFERSILELVIQCRQLEAQMRPSMRVIRKVLSEAQDYRSAKNYAQKFALMLNERDSYYCKFIYKACYEEMFLHYEFLEQISPEDADILQSFKQCDFPLVNLFEHYSEIQVKSFAALLAI